MRSPLLAIGLGAQLVLVAVLLSRAAGGLGDSAASSETIPVAAELLPLSPETGAATALEYARRWSPDAMLIAVTSRLDWPRDRSTLEAGELPNTGWLIYAFTDGDRTWSMYLDRGTGFKLADAESMFGEGDWVRLDLTTYPRSSEIAAAAADLLNGHDYRAACPESRTTAYVTATSIVGEQGARIPIWVVTYGDSRFGGAFDVLVKMDATTGNVIVNEARDRAC